MTSRAREAVPVTVTISYDLTGKFEYELASTPYMLRNQFYTDKVSYQIDVVKQDYDEFIQFLNRITASNYDLEEEDIKLLPSISQRLNLNDIKTITHEELSF